MAKFVLGDFESLRQPWKEVYIKARERLLFSSFDWSKLWWKHFGGSSRLHLGAIEENGHVIGIAPLRIDEGIARFIGSDNVCDFLDFVVEPGQEALFYSTLLDHLSAIGIDSLELCPILDKSSARTFMVDMAQKRNMDVSCTQEDVTVVMELPADLPAYLSGLSGKQRHELLRKERRLNEEGDISYRISGQPTEAEIATFLQFFRESREDKNRFMTDPMQAFFEALLRDISAERMLQMGVLELNKVPVAATLGFNYQNSSYLYNSGYNPAYRLLSVGVISKYYYIKDSIDSHRILFDFLKGAEKYKYYLGGTDVLLFSCIIKING